MTSTPAAAKDRITCHVLDTQTGTPARSLRVRLELTQAQAAAPGSTPPPVAAGHHGTSTKTFESQTDDDGRVKTWLPYSSSNASGEVPVYTLEDVLGAVETDQPSLWTLRFDTEAYFAAKGQDTFFPEVAVTFRVGPGEHYHVPVLLSPFSYTTYRGS